MKGQASKVDYTNILPVLFMEYLSISIARALLPKMIVEAFGSHSYLAVGIMETLKGLLAFVSSPLFGKLSDKIGTLRERFAPTRNDFTQFLCCLALPCIESPTSPIITCSRLSLSSYHRA